MTSFLRVTLLFVGCFAINFIACNGQSFVIESRSEGCSTPDKKTGTCTILRQCEHVMDIIKVNGITSPEVLKFLHQSTCGYEGSEPKVCCPEKKDSTDDRDNFNGNGNKEIESSKETGDNPDEPFHNPLLLLPNKCGEDHGNRIIGGEITELDEFPWMVVLEFEHPKGRAIGCGGTLINNRYVITAAHCIRAIPSTWRLRNVRLGEYDINTNPDCLDEGNGEKICADPVQFINVERAIVHESYMKPYNYYNDIALLRLVREARFTRYVQPICLPINGVYSKVYWSAGWGQIEQKASSDIKLKVRLPYVDPNECRNIYNNKRIFLGDNQMCAGGTVGRDTCKGDSGGPLMKQIRIPGNINKWVIEGIVSFGHSPCGLFGWPAVYTKVHKYVPWILSKLKP